MTKWLPVPGYEGLYQVSDEGDVLSAPRATTRGGLLKHLYVHGYPAVTLTRDGVQKQFRVHVLVALAFIGPRPEGQEVRHLDGNPANPSVANLAYGTHSENMIDMVEHGRGNVSKTHCPEGHEYTPENTLVTSIGGRFCLTCKRERFGYKGNPLSGERTHCPQGHPYDEENTLLSGGRRHCRTCRRERQEQAKAEAGDCAVADCGKPAMGRGWCSMHYARWRKHGDPLYEAVREPVICSEEECGTVAVARGLCMKHYARKRSAGELPPLKTA